MTRPAVFGFFFGFLFSFGLIWAGWLILKGAL